MYVHPPQAAFGNSATTYSTATMIPPFQIRLLHADYPSTILGIQYDSMVIILRDLRIPFDNSTEILWQSANYSHSESADIVKILVTCIVAWDSQGPL